ncbi:MAG: UvrB/UvrC motif-containing protein [Tissierellia bacterium]|nr:UvrB/UvrC motif-containing protein [Tissierellia bacterium]MDD4046341.1 UvrB/UvrC motif-containing protein [Tissierellia bacterium]
MLCNECGKNEANVHLTHIINGKKTESHLCEECAKKNQAILNSNFSMENLFSVMLNNSFNNKTYLPAAKSCTNCGMTYENFRNTGKFGCSHCIDSFKGRLKPVIKSIQGYDRHIGKIPKRAGGDYKIQMDIERLKNDLKGAVEREEYELAAELRDKINDLENKKGDEQFGK